MFLMLIFCLKNQHLKSNVREWTCVKLIRKVNLRRNVCLLKLIVLKIAKSTKITWKIGWVGLFGVCFFSAILEYIHKGIETNDQYYANRCNEVGSK